MEQPKRKQLKPRLTRGRPLPYGCSEGGPAGSVNFSLMAPETESAWLLLEVPSGKSEQGSKSLTPFRLSPTQNRSGPIWHVEITVSCHAEGLRYGWLLDPALGKDGLPLDSAPMVLDPCATALDAPCGATTWNRRSIKKYSPMAVVPEFSSLRNFNWEGVASPGYPLKDLVIYEAHVRSFTRHEDSGVSDWASNAGTFLGLIEKIPHLLRTGVNCVELLPIFEFDETACPRLHPETEEHLCNYWGYSTAQFFTPMQRFAANSEDRVSSAVLEFKTMVRELHRHGIEVVLDVVFNHTGEGAWGENNWHSLAKIAESHYYLMSNGYHTNYTGCGNTVNANDPVCSEWICQCLRYWALEMGVDGFRFDLAASLTRGEDGKISDNPPLIQRLVQDPLLQRVKLIAEPWDCSWPDGYLVGQFPSCGPPRFAEWNGKFRDTVRKFIKGDKSMKGDFATRICGSADLYEKDGRSPCHSINFVTAHDGFTLRDLVSYNKKHNSLNNEESGDDNNMSWNCGAEGSTTDIAVLELREKQMRNMLVALFLSAGTPMLTMGDEYGRSQEGNNNTWCQDKLNWFSWEACAAEESNLLRFSRLLISLRRHHGSLFARSSFFSDKDIAWNHDNWEDSYNFISFVLKTKTPVPADDAAGADALDAGAMSTPAQSTAASSDAGSAGSENGSGTTSAEGSERRVALLVAFNAGHLPHGCHLPGGANWHRLIDTSLAAPQDISETDEDAQLITGDNYLMTPYSCIVLKSFTHPVDSFTYGDWELECGQEQQLKEELRAVVTRALPRESDEEMEEMDGGAGWPEEFISNTAAGA